MWKTIDSNLTDEEIKSLLDKIQLEGGFTSEQELRTWIGKNTKIAAADFNPLKIPLAFDDEDFKIEATGHAGKVSKKITCYISETYKSLLLTGKLPEKKAADSKDKTTAVTASFKPEIVFWEMK
jgi:hypothetical protein